MKLIQFCCSYRTSYANSAAKYKAVEQVMGKSICPLIIHLLIYFLVSLVTTTKRIHLPRYMSNKWLFHCLAHLISLDRRRVF
jgi:hypothetical protein